MSVDAAFNEVYTDVIHRVCNFILAKTGEQISVNELAVEEACRQVEPTDGLLT